MNLQKKYNKKIDNESQIKNLENVNKENLEDVYNNIVYNQVSDRHVNIIISCLLLQTNN